MKVKKTTGEFEDFNKQKLLQSIRFAGSEEALAQEVAELVTSNKDNLTSTDKIHVATEQALVTKEAFGLAARYNLKRAIVDLGPSGYPFERYIARIFTAYGYAAKTNKMIAGKCVLHEIDVIATRGGSHYMIECKHHHYPGAKTNVKVALYIYARFLDVLETWSRQEGTEHTQHAPWLVTNTRATSDAIAYARCVGMQVLAWHYPQNQGLNHLIENKHLYPITVLPHLAKSAKQVLLNKDIILVKELLHHTPQQLQQLTQLRSEAVKQIYLAANQLINF